MTVSHLVAILAAAGVFSWLLLVVVDTVVGAVTRSDGGTFDVQKLKQFLVSNFATKEALVMAGLVGTAGAAAAAKALIGNAAGGADITELLKFVGVAALSAFSLGAVAQDAALVKDILKKLGIGESPVPATK